MDRELAEKVRKLSVEDQELFEERSAIMEFDGKMSRTRAEYESYICLMRSYVNVSQNLNKNKSTF
ncbi:uncharacterized protein Dvar_51530 [Desulfosarcina variabilis str. Montpellier]